MSTNYVPGAPASLFCSRCGASVSATDSFCPNCAAPQQAQPMVVQPFVPAVQRTYAGFWIRFGAVFIDSIVVNLLLSPVFFLTSLFMSRFASESDNPPIGPMFIVIGMAMTLGLLASWLYEALMLSSSKQGTIGKMVFGLIVTDTTGRRIGFGRATGRHFAKYLSGMTLIGYLMAGFTERKQALHDMIAGTYVLRGKPDPSV